MIPSLKPVELHTQPIHPSRVMRDVTRLLVQTALQPSELPDLQFGEEVLARVTEHLGDNRLSVLIKNKLFILDFPPNHRPRGELLKLRVQSLAPRLMFALVDTYASADQDKNAAARVLLSSSFRYLSDLLQRGQYQNTVLNQALLARFDEQQGRVDAALLAQRLQDMLARSGLSYEANLKAWYEGKKTLKELQRQPQALLASHFTQLAARTNPEDVRLALADLGHILQRQLDVLNHHVLFLNVLAWPGQDMELRIEEEGDPERVESEVPSWLTRLRFELPHLGTLAVALRFQSGSVEVQFVAEHESTYHFLNEQKQKLLEQFDGSGLSLKHIGVDHA